MGDGDAACPGDTSQDRRRHVPRGRPALETLLGRAGSFQLAPLFQPISSGPARCPPPRNRHPRKRPRTPSACGFSLHPKAAQPNPQGSGARDDDAMSRALLAHVLHRPPHLAVRSGAGARGGAFAHCIRPLRRLNCSATEAAAGSSEEAPAPPARKKRVASGVQPTGMVHLGNYLGAIKNWVSLQELYETFFFIVDLHAITLPYEAPQLSKATRSTAAIYLACGIDSSKASIFVQSHVRAHVELMWLLSSSTPIGWLNRMIQFKEKSRKAGDENVGVALLTYPVLMASDILLYQSDLVPVGEDQTQHLELTREIAERVNNLYMAEENGRKWEGEAILAVSFLTVPLLVLSFRVPEALIPPAGARVMSLTDGLSKMSKSAPSDQSRINLLDPKDVIANKIKRCKTGFTPRVCISISLDLFSLPLPLHWQENSLSLNLFIPDWSLTIQERPECRNLLSIYQIITGKTKEVHPIQWPDFQDSEILVLFAL
ncbi:hypothetical protein PR202_gb04798 [Eleusine coracana subsp. coracana]|uniref:tryptophan--tRNA ligase n=1 Tax=Eleusine coracana subsp. coracana TaxID=191504 RepID=A0AAV5E521_ELECO|nr:hypothetical protein PR202_gb04798 [Eleusine coracana subsp. coracana]